MLLRLTHISLNSSCPEEDIRTLTARGAILDWFNKDIPQPAIKRHFLLNYEHTHDLAMLSLERGPKVEVVGQRSKLSVPVFLHEWSVSENTVIFVAQTENRAASERFWAAIGFKPDADAAMTMKPVLDAMPVRIVMHPTTTLHATKSDKFEWYAVAFLTNDVQREKMRLDKLGVATTEIISLHVAGNDLALFFSMGDNGELVEFYSLVKNAAVKGG